MLNITSLPKHIDEICVLLATKNFDILALNETRLDHSIPDDLVNIPNYDIIRNDRNRNGGGVCIYRGGSRGYRAYLLIRSDFSDIVHDYIVVYMFTTSDICAI